MKTIKKLLFLLAFFVFCLECKAQTIPDSLLVDWMKAGYSGSIANPSLIINVKDFGAYGDSLHDDYNAIMNAINSSSNLRVIFFPAGNYLIKSSISLPANTVLRGEGAATNLYFDLSAINKTTNCIDVVSLQRTSFANIENGFQKKSTSITVENENGFLENSFAEIVEDNQSWDTVVSNPYVGQIVRVAGISGKQIFFTPELRLDYNASLHPRIRPVVLKDNVGIECLRITRLDSPTANNSGDNINFSYAYNCWLAGIESNKCQTAHVTVSFSKNVTISGSYFHDAFTYNGGGQAYGVQMVNHTSDCKLENCVFTRLRHAMLAARGANGNVYGYNYSFDPRSTTEIPPDAIGDISLHGHFAYANLFEGNICANIFADDFWGPSGPYNTFFRNRATLYGIVIFDQYNYPVKTKSQIIVGNEVTNGDSMKGNYTLAGSDHYTYANNIKGTIKPEGTNDLADKSYYLTAQPYFWNDSLTWPPIGLPNEINTGTIPSKLRYETGEYTSCAKETTNILSVIATADSIACNGGNTVINVYAAGGEMPYLYSCDGINFQTQNSFTKPAGTYTITVVDNKNDTVKTAIAISQPTSLKASSFKTNELCNGDASASITVKASGGTIPYQYNLNSLNYQSSNVFSALKAGTYIATVKDARTCIYTLPFVKITQPTALKISFQVKNVTCKKGSDGMLTITASGSTAPYQYQLNGGAYQANNIFNNLIAGTYTLSVKDINNCVVTKTGIKIKQPASGCTTFADAAKSSLSSNLVFSVSPNPSNNFFILNFLNCNNQKVVIKVKDVFGKEIFNTNGFCSRQFYFGEKFTAGIYFVQIFYDKQVKTIKLVKQ